MTIKCYLFLNARKFNWLLSHKEHPQVMYHKLTINTKTVGKHSLEMKTSLENLTNHRLKCT